MREDTDEHIIRLHPYSTEDLAALRAMEHPETTPNGSARRSSTAGASARFHPVRIGDLAPSEPPRFLWPGYAARGCSTLLTGLWKGGKSTLLAYLLRDLGRGGGLVDDPADGPALIVSEESAAAWARRRDELDLGDWISICARPFRSRPSAGEWESFIDKAAAWVREHAAALVVFDTLPALWCCPDENDAAQVLAALTPLGAITEAGAALVLVHHPRKSDGAQGQAGRGSGALPGWVDAIVELRRAAPDDAHDRRRTLTAYTRFDDTPPETLIELGPDGYRVLGERVIVARADRLDRIKAVLPKTAPGWTAEEVREALGGSDPVGLTTVRGELVKGARDGLWQTVGSGRKNDPRRFYRGDGFHSDNAPP